MAVIDDLVSSGLSGTQATEVVAVGAGTGSESALVSQGFSGTQAAAIVAGGNIDELVHQGLFGTQAVAVNAAVGGGGGGGGGGTTYTHPADYTFGSFNGMGTYGPVGMQGMSGAMTSAFSALTVGTVITATYLAGSMTAILTVAEAPVFQGPGSGDWSVVVNSDTMLMGMSFNSLAF